VARPLLGGSKLARRPHVALPCSRGSSSRFNFYTSSFNHCSYAHNVKLSASHDHTFCLANYLPM
jgi:hypothetical protein